MRNGGRTFLSNVSVDTFKDADLADSDGYSSFAERGTFAHLKNIEGQFIPDSAVEHNRSLDPHHHRLACKPIECQVAKVFDVFHRNMDYQVVTSAHQERPANLWDGFRLVQEPVHHRPFMLRKLNKEKCLQS